MALTPVLTCQAMETSDRQIRAARFWKKFLRLTRGRVPVMRALDVISGEEKNTAFKNVVADIQKAMAGGMTLSEAVAEHPEHFSPSIRELVRTAEKTGAWDEILAEIADGLADGTFD